MKPNAPCSDYLLFICPQRIHNVVGEASYRPIPIPIPKRKFASAPMSFSKHEVKKKVMRLEDWLRAEERIKGRKINAVAA